MIKADRRSERAAEAALRASDSPTATSTKRGRKRIGKRPSKQGESATTKMPAGGGGVDDDPPDGTSTDGSSAAGRKRKTAGDPGEIKRVRIRPVSSMTEGLAISSVKTASVSKDPAVSPEVVVSAWLDLQLKRLRGSSSSFVNAAFAPGSSCEDIPEAQGSSSQTSHSSLNAANTQQTAKQGGYPCEVPDDVAMSLLLLSSAS